MAIAKSPGRAEVVETWVRQFCKYHMELPHSSDKDSTLPFPLLLQHHQVSNPCRPVLYSVSYTAVLYSVSYTEMQPANRPSSSRNYRASLPRYFAHPITGGTHWRRFGRSLGNEIMQSFWDFEFENGRRYHGYKAGSYPLPNDEVRTTTHLSQMTHCSALSGVKSRRSTDVSLLESWCSTNRWSSNDLILNTMSWCYSAAAICILHLSQVLEEFWILERARVSGQCRWQSSTQNPWWLGPISLLSNQESTSLWLRWAKKL